MLYIKGQGMVEGDPLEQWAPYTMGGPLPVQAKTSVVTFQAEGDELQVILEALSNAGQVGRLHLLPKRAA